MGSRQEADQSDSEPEFDPLNPNTQDDEGWEDAEPEEEDQFTFISLFDQSTLSSVQSWLEYDKSKHGFDLLATRQQLNLDFVGMIKLVNFIRSEVKSGNTRPDFSTQDRFSDDKYMQPVLEDDAVLFSLGELDDGDEDQDAVDTDKTDVDANLQIERLEQELRQAREMVAELRLVAQRSLEDSDEMSSTAKAETNRKEKAIMENDQSYFKSYAYNDIHEVMLKDTVRTDAYRDFIYDNKDLFAGKTVLDVGCGTGILSMMCARAGAKQVFAIDNSDIINKARANVVENGLQGVVSCLHGKIEELNLPVKQVDIIVSEWMGYALLYESMLDSVISARDRYLAPDGLMVPSHSTLFIAPIAVPDVVTDRVGFWDDVYGFRMQAMLEGIHDEILLRNLVADDVVGTPAGFLQLSLHTTTVSDTKFANRSFTSKVIKEADPMDGFAVWFDMFFARSRDTKVPANTRAQEWTEGTAFTTGPGKATTHWQQVVLLANNVKTKKESAKNFSVGDSIEGEVSYDRREENDRLLDISVSWRRNDDGGSQRRQKWELV